MSKRQYTVTSIRDRLGKIETSYSEVSYGKAKTEPDEGLGKVILEINENIFRTLDVKKATTKVTID